MKSKRSRIKPALLDQNLVAGVGNIYADESLHRSRISPLRRCNRISIARLEILHSAIIAVLKHAIEFISTHPSADGSPYVVDAYDERMRDHARIEINLPRLRPSDRFQKHQRPHRLLLPADASIRIEVTQPNRNFGGVAERFNALVLKTSVTSR